MFKESLGKSVFEKPIDLITISHPDNVNLRKDVAIEEDEGEELKKIKVVFIMARVHPGETPSSFVVQGLIDFLVSSHDIAARDLQTKVLSNSFKLSVGLFNFNINFL